MFRLLLAKISQCFLSGWNYAWLNFYDFIEASSTEDSLLCEK
jgi:hypothetical protein